jgi:hypothetical protein
VREHVRDGHGRESRYDRAFPAACATPSAPGPFLRAAFGGILAARECPATAVVRLPKPSPLARGHRSSAPKRPRRRGVAGPPGSGKPRSGRSRAPPPGGCQQRPPQCPAPRRTPQPHVACARRHGPAILVAHRTCVISACWAGAHVTQACVWAQRGRGPRQNVPRGGAERGGDRRGGDQMGGRDQHE